MGLSADTTGLRPQVCRNTEVQEYRGYKNPKGGGVGVHKSKHN